MLYPSERIPQEGTIAHGADTLWNIVPACELHNECDPNHCEQGSARCPRSVRFNQVTPEDVAWCERQSAFPRLRVSAAGVACHEQRLFADIAVFAAKNAARLERQVLRTATVVDDGSAERDRLLDSDGLTITEEIADQVLMMGPKEAALFVKAHIRLQTEQRMAANGHAQARYFAEIVSDIKRAFLKFSPRRATQC